MLISYITVHGNAGSVSQGWRPDAYRSLSSNAHAHILAIDYRGFGYSTGIPTYEGLIKDAYAAIDWATNVAKLPTSRIVLVGQSLGTGVVAGIAQRYLEDHGISSPFAGIVLVAGFSELNTLLLTYSIGGLIPVLGPLRSISSLQGWFLGQLHEPWNTKENVKRLVARSEHLDLTIIHAKNDQEIPWLHSDTLFHAAVNGTSDDKRAGYSKKQVEALQKYEDRSAGGFTNTWITAGVNGQGKRTIRQEVMSYGSKATLSPAPLLVEKPESS